MSVIFYYTAYTYILKCFSFRAIGPSCVFCMLIVYELKPSSFFPLSSPIIIIIRIIIIGNWLLLYGTTSCLSVRRAQ